MSSRIKPCKVPSGFKRPNSSPSPPDLPNGIKTSSTQSEIRSSLAGVEKLFEECMDYLLRTRILRSAPVGSGQGAKPLLVCGGTGCGKTAMTKEIAERLAGDRHVLAGENILFFRHCLIVSN
jgi:hypothetical protein